MSTEITRAGRPSASTAGSAAGALRWLADEKIGDDLALQHDHRHRPDPGDRPPGGNAGRGVRPGADAGSDGHQGKAGAQHAAIAEATAQQTQRQRREHPQQHIAADQAAKLGVAQAESLNQFGAQAGDGLELVAERNPGERQGRENNPGAKLHPVPQKVPVLRRDRTDPIQAEPR